VPPGTFPGGLHMFDAAIWVRDKHFNLMHFPSFLQLTHQSVSGSGSLLLWFFRENGKTPLVGTIATYILYVACREILDFR
jgi:hypothetical protein